MPHDFDTGLDHPQRTLVLEGTIALLQRMVYVATPAPSGYLRALVEFEGKCRGPTDDVAIMDLFDLLQGRAPAIAVSVGDCDFDPAGEEHRWTGRLDVDVYFYSTSLRSKSARSKADVVALANLTKAPGLHTMLEHARMFLVGQKPVNDTSIKRLRALRERELATLDGFALWMQEYTVTVGVNTDRKRDIDQELLTIGTAVAARLLSSDPVPPPPDSEEPSSPLTTAEAVTDIT